MPLFRRKSEGEKQEEEERARLQAEGRALQQASLEALERGGIPVEAERRLEDLRKHGGLYTSDLSVNEFLLAREAGARILSQVMGSSIYHVGWQSLPRFSGSMEMTTVSSALNHARELALGRMRQEAQRVNANAVVGVRMGRRSYDWATGAIEFDAVGTAVRFEGIAPHTVPALTNLSVQDFWSLRRSGYRPVGVVAGSTVYYVMAGWQTRQAMSWARWANQELVDFTQGLYTARHLAMRHVHEQARDLGAEGIVGMQIEEEQHQREVDQGGVSRTDMIFTFHVIGTAIAPDAPNAEVPGIDTAVSLSS